jgi:hypothetical protein
MVNPRRPLVIAAAIALGAVATLQVDHPDAADARRRRTPTTTTTAPTTTAPTTTRAATTTLAPATTTTTLAAATTVAPTTTRAATTTTVAPTTTVVPSNAASTTTTTTTTVAPTTTRAATTTTAAPTTTVAPTTARRTAALWPFASNSPWNFAVGSGAQYAAASSPQTANLVNPGVPIWINAAEYSHPVYRSTSSDPLVSVSWRYAVFSPWVNGVTAIRIPTAAKPAAGIDAHLHVIEQDGVTLHETFEFARTSTGATAFKYGRFDLRGSGLGSRNGVNDGSRAYGGSALAGLIRRWELEDGAIRHALALTLTNGQLKKGWVWPATSEDTGSSTYAGLVPMGALVAIPPSVDLGSLGLSREGLIVARALQDYGAYVVDRGGAVAFYAEPSAEGLLAGARADLAKLRPHLRVVTNNGPTSVGGGGTPRQPAAPPL